MATGKHPRAEGGGAKSTSSSTAVLLAVPGYPQVKAVPGYPQVNIHTLTLLFFNVCFETVW